ncbi:hypothetical protein B0H13DRAFT_1628685 [Mycena leptocephala]|nr:hypothetical protein B0H13DRAFT_1628685 [Mycena leptocephala]
MVSLPWPSSKDVDKLVEKSSGYFIYAATVIKFIDDKDFRPTERLAVIMGFTIQDSPEDESPYWTLDQLYIQILSQTRRAARPRLLEILTVIISDLHLGLRHMEQLLELKPGDMQLALRGLHSVLKVPTTIGSDTDSINVYHASFPDFLEDPSRSGSFYVGGCQHKQRLVCRILKAFCDTNSLKGGHVAWRVH